MSITNEGKLLTYYFLGPQKLPRNLDIDNPFRLLGFTQKLRVTETTVFLRALASKNQ